MGRHKTISDDEVLRAARDVFRERGHTATTREISKAVGISEAVIYQRFNSKDELFFAAMCPNALDVAELLGPIDPPDDAREYLRIVVVRLGKHFADVIPLALHVMTHPSFSVSMLPRVQAALSELKHGLTLRLVGLSRRGKIVTTSESTTAQLIVSLAHDWALGNATAQVASSKDIRLLEEMVDVVWEAIRPRAP